MTFTFQAAWRLGYRTFGSRYGPLLGASGVCLLVLLIGPGKGFLASVFIDGPLWVGMVLLAVRHELLA